MILTIQINNPAKQILCKMTIDKKWLYNKFTQQIHQCDKPCKMPTERMLLGRWISQKESMPVDIMFIGLAPNPNYHGSCKRVVFGPYSPAGKKIIAIFEAMQAHKKDVSCWGTNIIKCDCHPEKFKETMERCNDFLTKEIEIICPKAIVLFGGKLVKNILGENLSHSKVSLRGEFNYIHSFHPASRGNLGSAEIKILVEKILTVLNK